MKVLALLSVLLLVSPVFAASLEFERPGIPYDSPFYGITRFLENVQYALTFGNAAKSELEIRFAEKRLIDAKMAAENGDWSESVKYANEYSQYMSRSEALALKLNEGGFTDQQEKTIGYHTEFLEEIKEMLPAEAQFGIDSAIDNSQKYSGYINNKVI